MIKYIEEKRKHLEEALADLAREEEVAKWLPEVWQRDNICNYSNLDGNPAAWISIYEKQENWSQVHDLFRALFDAGWKQFQEVSLVWVEQYAAKIHVGHAVPEFYDRPGCRGKVKKHEPVAPYWVVINRHTGLVVKTLLQRSDGLVFLFSVAVRHGGFGVSGRQDGIGEDWGFVRGSQEVYYPEHLTVHPESRAVSWVPQSLDGYVYFPVGVNGDTVLDFVQKLQKPAQEKKY